MVQGHDGFRSFGIGMDSVNAKFELGIHHHEDGLVLNFFIKADQGDLSDFLVMGQEMANADGSMIITLPIRSIIGLSARGAN